MKRVLWTKDGIHGNWTSPVRLAGPTEGDSTLRPQGGLRRYNFLQVGVLPLRTGGFIPMRTVAFIAVFAVVAGSMIEAQQSVSGDSNAPKFKVASIKPADPAARGWLYQMPGREYRASNTSAKNLIEWAYSVHPCQIIGAPDWIGADKFNIVAIPNMAGLPSWEQWNTMVKTLLADRWQLRFHREQKELPVYGIQIGEGGPKLTRSAADPARPWSMAFRSGTLPVRNASVAEFASWLQRAVLDRPVIDQTGLEGKWDFVLKWTRERNDRANMGTTPQISESSADAPGDLFTAVENQLGLKLVATKAMVDVISVDHVEKPTAN
jgi:uncharacterized protein (TIGR03435 family)